MSEVRFSWEEAEVALPPEAVRLFLRLRGWTPALQPIEEWDRSNSSHWVDPEGRKTYPWSTAALIELCTASLEQQNESL